MKRKLVWIFILILLSTNISCANSLGYKNLSFLKYENLHLNDLLTYSDSPIEQFLINSKRNKSHYITILNNGDDALLAKTHLIRQAQKLILIQTFIWGSDETSRFVVYELIQAAKRGVKIKIILDYLISSKDFKLITFLTNAHPNIEVKLYNPISKNIVPSKLALIKKLTFDFRGFNQRMHNKIFIVDDKIAITGGRNYQNDYYDRGTNRNFKDYEIAITGKLVKKMTDSFIEYWLHPLSVPSKDMVDVQRLIKNNKYPQYSSRKSFMLSDLFTELDACEVNKDCLNKRILDITYQVKKIKFIADKPGKTGQVGKAKVTKTTYELGNFFRQAKKSLIIQTPYVVIGKRSARFFTELAKNKPDLEIFVSSNSLSSADHVHAYAFSYKNKKKYINSFRWQMFEFKLKPEDLDLIITPINKNERTKKYITTLHSKVYIVDSESVWVGSFNLDPRSANLNTEVGVIIDDKIVAEVIEKDIRRDMANQNSWTIAKQQGMPIVSQFNNLLSNIVGLIPIVDIWPFTYSGSFELKPEKTVKSCFNKDFYNNYRYAGPFPDVQLTEKEIKARLIKTFLGPVQPLI
ncbi:MAG: phospholipase D family protein [Candidatus Omnitrophica bacterium]|nr:phospholipase D family protein [Candidatus Omnitrophota bacterium]